MNVENAPEHLARELGLVRGMRAWFHGVPERIHAAIDPDAIGVEEQSAPSDGIQFTMLFVTSSERLARQLTAVRSLMPTKAIVWIAWPTPAAGTETDLDEHRIRDLARSHDLTEIKTCAVDADWASMQFRVQRP